MSASSETGRRAFLIQAAAVAASGQPGPKPVRVGVVGVGGRGTFLASTLVKLAQEGTPVEIAAVCDIYQPRLERAEARFKAKGFHRSADMLREVPMDAVVIATPDRHHLHNLREAIRAGKDAYCEKPICHWSQFDLLKQVVHENRRLERIVQVGTQFVADPVWEKAGAALRSGAIGKPVHAQTCYFRRGDQGESGMPIDDPNAKPGVGVDWDTFQADAARREFSVSRLFQWRLFLDYSGGPVTDVYPHNLTPLYKTLQPGMPKKVVAVGGRYLYAGERDVPDTFDLLIEYPQGLTVVCLGTFINNTGIDTVIRGTEGTLTRTADSITVVAQPGVKRARQELRADVPGSAGSVLAAAHLKDFVEAVRERRQPRSDLELQYTVQTPVIMAMRSHLENKAALFDAGREEIRMA